MSKLLPCAAIALEAELQAKTGILALVQKHTPLSSKFEFWDLMNACFNTNIISFETRKISDDLGFSHPSVEKWCAGEKVPHKVVWPKIVEWITDKLSKDIEGAKAQLGE